MVPDVFAGGGSLGGIYSGLKAAPGAAIFTVACDMPFLRPDVARLVIERAEEADVVVPRAGGQLETLHACYGKRCLDPMERASARAGSRSSASSRTCACSRFPRRTSRGSPRPRSCS